MLADPAASVLATRDRANLVIALASLIHSAGRHSAEPGGLVEDAWQRRGIRRRLVAH